MFVPGLDEAYDMGVAIDSLLNLRALFSLIIVSSKPFKLLLNKSSSASFLISAGNFLTVQNLRSICSILGFWVKRSRILR